MEVRKRQTDRDRRRKAKERKSEIGRGRKVVVAVGERRWTEVVEIE